MVQSNSILPVYDFSVALNDAYRQKIFPLLADHGIAANPINYALLYDYVTESNPELNQTIDTLLGESKTLDMQTSQELYTSFICNTSLESFETIHHKIHQVLTRATEAVDATCDQAEQAGEGFEQKTTQLENTSDIANHQAIIRDIIKETRALAVTTQAMQLELSRTNAEMDELRTELVSVRKVATTDGLTGLLNRHALHNVMYDIILGDESEAVSLCFLDIDHFKKVNDTFGHSIGDNVIKYVASLTKKYVSEHHHVARYGGEELVIVMPDTSQRDAMAIAENIRSDMQKTRLKRKSDNTVLGEITVSIGVAQKQPGDSVESFISRADKALYKAKGSGRNRVVG